MDQAGDGDRKRRDERDEEAAKAAGQASGAGGTRSVPPHSRHPAVTAELFQERSQVVSYENNRTVITSSIIQRETRTIHHASVSSRHHYNVHGQRHSRQSRSRSSKHENQFTNQHNPIVIDDDGDGESNTNVDLVDSDIEYLGTNLDDNMVPTDFRGDATQGRADSTGLDMRVDEEDDTEAGGVNLSVQRTVDEVSSTEDFDFDSMSQTSTSLRSEFSPPSKRKRTSSDLGLNRSSVLQTEQDQPGTSRQSEGRGPAKKPNQSIELPEEILNKEVSSMVKQDLAGQECYANPKSVVNRLTQLQIETRSKKVLFEACNAHMEMYREEVDQQRVSQEEAMRMWGNEPLQQQSKAPEIDKEPTDAKQGDAPAASEEPEDDLEIEPDFTSCTKLNTRVKKQNVAHLSQYNFSAARSCLLCKLDIVSGPVHWKRKCHIRTVNGLVNECSRYRVVFATGPLLENLKQVMEVAEHYRHVGNLVSDLKSKAFFAQPFASKRMAYDAWIGAHTFVGNLHAVGVVIFAFILTWLGREDERCSGVAGDCFHCDHMTAKAKKKWIDDLNELLGDWELIKQRLTVLIRRPKLKADDNQLTLNLQRVVHHEASYARLDSTIGEDQVYTVTSIEDAERIFRDYLSQEAKKRIKATNAAAGATPKRKNKRKQAGENKPKKGGASESQEMEDVSSLLSESEVDAGSEHRMDVTSPKLTVTSDIIPNVAAVQKGPVETESEISGRTRAASKRRRESTLGGRLCTSQESQDDLRRQAEALHLPTPHRDTSPKSVTVDPRLVPPPDPNVEELVYTVADQSNSASGTPANSPQSQKTLLKVVFKSQAVPKSMDPIVRLPQMSPEQVAATPKWKPKEQSSKETSGNESKKETQAQKTSAIKYQKKMNISSRHKKKVIVTFATTEEKWKIVEGVVDVPDSIRKSLPKIKKWRAAKKVQTEPDPDSETCDSDTNIDTNDLDLIDLLLLYRSRETISGEDAEHQTSEASSSQVSVRDRLAAALRARPLTVEDIEEIESRHPGLIDIVAEFCVSQEKVESPEASEVGKAGDSALTQNQEAQSKAEAASSSSTNVPESNNETVTSSATMLKDFVTSSSVTSAAGSKEASASSTSAVDDATETEPMETETASSNTEVISVSDEETQAAATSASGSVAMHESDKAEAEAENDTKSEANKGGVNDDDGEDLTQQQDGEDDASKNVWADVQDKWQQSDDDVEEDDPLQAEADVEQMRDDLRYEDWKDFQDRQQEAAEDAENQSTDSNVLEDENQPTAPHAPMELSQEVQQTSLPASDVNVEQAEAGEAVIHLDDEDDAGSVASVQVISVQDTAGEPSQANESLTDAELVEAVQNVEVTEAAKKVDSQETELTTEVTTTETSVSQEKNPNEATTEPVREAEPDVMTQTIPVTVQTESVVTEPEISDADVASYAPAADVVEIEDQQNEPENQIALNTEVGSEQQAASANIELQPEEVQGSASQAGEIPDHQDAPAEADHGEQEESDQSPPRLDESMDESLVKEDVMLPQQPQGVEDAAMQVVSRPTSLLGESPAASLSGEPVDEDISADAAMASLEDEMALFSQTTKTWDEGEASAALSALPQVYEASPDSTVSPMMSPEGTAEDRGAGDDMHETVVTEKMDDAEDPITRTPDPELSLSEGNVTVRRRKHSQEASRATEEKRARSELEEPSSADITTSPQTGTDNDPELSRPDPETEAAVASIANPEQQAQADRAQAALRHNVRTEQFSDSQSTIAYDESPPKSTGARSSNGKSASDISDFFGPLNASDDINIDNLDLDPAQLTEQLCERPKSAPILGDEDSQAVENALALSRGNFNPDDAQPMSSSSEEDMARFTRELNQNSSQQSTAASSAPTVDRQTVSQTVNTATSISTSTSVSQAQSTAFSVPSAQATSAVTQSQAAVRPPVMSTENTIIVTPTMLQNALRQNVTTLSLLSQAYAEDHSFREVVSVATRVSRIVQQTLDPQHRVSPSTARSLARSLNSAVNAVAEMAQYSVNIPEMQRQRSTSLPALPSITNTQNLLSSSTQTSSATTVSSGVQQGATGGDADRAAADAARMPPPSNIPRPAPLPIQQPQACSTGAGATKPPIALTQKPIQRNPGQTDYIAHLTPGRDMIVSVRPEIVPSGPQPTLVGTPQLGPQMPTSLTTAGSVRPAGPAAVSMVQPTGTRRVGSAVAPLAGRVQPNRHGQALIPVPQVQRSQAPAASGIAASSRTITTSAGSSVARSSTAASSATSAAGTARVRGRQQTASRSQTSQGGRRK